MLFRSLYLKKPNFLKRLFVGDPRVVFEIASQTGGNDISFYAAVPRYLESALEKYIQGIYPRAIVERVPKDYTIFEADNISSGAYLELENSSVFPLNTYENLDKDPLSITTNALSKIAPDEGAAIQLVISPLNQERWREVCRKVIRGLREKKSSKEAVSKAFG